jgi:bifunctional non-homologous end joining protein LigD
MPTPESLLRRLMPPMLATLADAPPRNGDDWIYELKYDGFRALIAIVDGKMAMWSRNQIDLAGRFPRIAEAVGKLKVPDVVLDGEIVALDEAGTPRFQLLQQGERERLIVFDVLWLDGRDLRNETYVDRRKVLEKLLKKTPAQIDVARILDMTGDEALAFAAERKLEGIIAKKKSSCYEPRRSKEWLKVKSQNEQELIIVGWHPSNHSPKEIGSLHLAVNDGGTLRYAGKVGTGFSAKQRVWLRDELAKDVVEKSPVADAPRFRDATWVRPRLVAQVSFTEWTSDNRLRHPSFLGLRDDKPAGEVVRERPMATAKASGKKAAATSKKRSSGNRIGAAPPAVVLSNPGRVLYPRDRITKAELADYYEAVSGPMMRALKDRPLSLEHWNQGIDKPSWYQQGLGKEAPGWLTLVETPTRTTGKPVKHLVIDKPEALRWLAQMSVLTIHMWASRAPKLEQADWVVFDLDPAKGKGIEQAIDAAIVMRKLLENLGLPSVPKTSGKRGIHVFVPLAPGYTHEQAGEWAFRIASAVAAQVPEITVERALAKRRGRLYLDSMQNAYGKTVVAPYSPRAIDGAPVSAPLRWSEVTKKLDPLKYTIRTMPDRLAKVGDLFEAVFEQKAKLPQFG